MILRKIGVYFLGFVLLLTGCSDSQQKTNETKLNTDIDTVSVAIDTLNTTPSVPIVYPKYIPFNSADKDSLIQNAAELISQQSLKNLTYNTYAPIPFDKFQDRKIEQYLYCYSGFDLQTVLCEHSANEKFMIDCELFYYKNIPDNPIPQPYYMKKYTAEVIEGNIVPLDIDEPKEILYFNNGRLVKYIVNNTEVTDTEVLAEVQYINCEKAIDLVSNTTNSITVNFTGEYSYSKNSDKFSFSTKLSQKGDKVFGTYCGHTETKVDCGVESQGAPDCFVQGIIKKDTLYLTYQSCHAGAEGTAKMYFQNNNLIWKTLTYPEGFCAVPSEGILLP